MVDLSDEEREMLGIEKGGVLVKSVRSGPANDAGVEKGDVITMINGVTVEDSKHFKTLVESLPVGRSVAILVQRRDGPVFLAMKLPVEE